MTCNGIKQKQAFFVSQITANHPNAKLFRTIQNYSKPKPKVSGLRAIL